MASLGNKKASEIQAPVKLEVSFIREIDVTFGKQSEVNIS